MRDVQTYRGRQRSRQGHTHTHTHTHTHRERERERERERDLIHEWLACSALSQPHMDRSLVVKLGRQVAVDKVWPNYMYLF